MQGVKDPRRRDGLQPPRAPGQVNASWSSISVSMVGRFRFRLPFHVLQAPRICSDESRRLLLEVFWFLTPHVQHVRLLQHLHFPSEAIIDGLAWFMPPVAKSLESLISDLTPSLTPSIVPSVSSSLPLSGGFQSVTYVFIVQFPSGFPIRSHKWGLRFS